MDIKLKKVLITGASKRIGSAMAMECAKNGWDIVLHYNKSKRICYELQKKLLKISKSVEIFNADLSKEKEVVNLFKSASKFSPINALINNASLFEYDNAKTFNTENLIKHINVNSIAPAILIKNLRENLPKKSKANVINILDAKLFGLNPDYYSYTLSKSLLEFINKISAQSFAPFLRINAIAPGIVLPSGKQTIKEFNKAHKKNPLRNGANIKELLSVMNLLLNTETMTGEVIILDGGNHLQPTPRDVAFLKD